MAHARHSMPAAAPAYRRIVRFTALLAAAGAISLATVPAANADDNGLTLSDAWVRVIVPSRPAAGYFTLKNDSDTARALTGASSPACGSVMLHQSKTENGVDKMVMVTQVEVPAHGTLQFAPHGYHLMCMKPSADMKQGQQVPMTLRFADGATLTGQFEVHVGAGP